LFASKAAKPQAKTGEGTTKSPAPHGATSAAYSLEHDSVEQLLSGGGQKQMTGDQNTTARQAPRGVSWTLSRTPILPPEQLHAGSTAVASQLSSGRVSERSQAEPEARTPPLFGGSSAPRNVGRVLDGPGHPLDTATLSNFQNSFGHDFSSVRVHTDERAAASAAALSARAYTIGSHVVFGRGEYAPGTSNGRQLLGHELAHVVQQSRGGTSAPAGQDPSLEAAADHAANLASQGAPVKVAGSSAVGIACKTLFEEFTKGKYAWGLLKAAIEHTRPVATIIEDVKGLTAAERDQAMTDITQERAERGRKLAYQTGRQSIQTDPQHQAFYVPLLAESKRVLDRFDAVIDGLALPGVVRKSIPGWNFTPEDYAKLQGANKDLTMAPDSSWVPAKIQENLLKTLAFVLGPSISPAATEGINALDFAHGHLVVKKDPATDKEAQAAVATSDKIERDLIKARNKAIGEMSYIKGYRMNDKKIAAYQKVLEKIQPSLTSLMETTLNMPGAAVIYHTFEFIHPHDLKVKGKGLHHLDPRRHYLTPLDTNTPSQYTPPAGTYEAEYTHIAKFTFLVDAQGAVHVRPLETNSGLTTLELSTITGTTFPEPLEIEK
jgi:hypothetical protein